VISAYSTGAPARQAEPAGSTPSRQRLLVVEDDDAVAEPLVEGLERYGFAVTRVRTGEEALAAADVELVLLDLGLPDCNGSVVCNTLHRRADVPIIVITASGDEVDRVALLEGGADDYVVKPFGLRELVARIHAVRRRTGKGVRTGPDEAQVLAALEIDRRARKVRLHGSPLHLTPKEYAVLELLARDPGGVVSREELLRTVWDEHWWGPTKTLDVHVTSLRKKLGDRRWITVARGVGFRLEPRD
jgi:two-component system, OmpR family, response regulator RegX3